MASSAPDPSLRGLMNVPNQLTSARLVLAIILFIVFSLGHYQASLVLFIIAASTDWLDGFWARRYGQVTVLGRILDPFADKLIICGMFVFLVAVPQSGVEAWMAVVILGRELLVTALRSYLEQQGADFSARASGKWKMVLQCVAAGTSLYRLTYLDISHSPAVWATTPPPWLNNLLVVSVWSAVIITLYSGITYIAAAVRLVR